MDVGLLQGFANALSPVNVGWALLGSLVGTLIGVLPGLGPASALSILLPITLHLPPDAALITMMAIYYGAQYGGSTTAILINVPGEVSSVATCLDGYPLARQGRAASALAIVAIGSFAAATASIALLGWLAPPLAALSLLFGPPEYFALLLVSLLALAALSGPSPVRGALAALLGLLLTTVGLDPLDGIPRFTFGSVNLSTGFDIVPVLIGLFGVGEVLRNMESNLKAVFVGRLSRWFPMPSRSELAASAAPIARGSVVGFVLGLLPGMGSSVTTWIAYDLEKRISRTPERFGQGEIAGVASPEAANNATAISGMIPLMAFGIPTVPALAIMLAALQIYGLQPGPLLFEQHAAFTWTVIAAMYVGNAICLVLNLPLVGLWSRIASVPYRLLGPLILIIALIASYGSRNSLFDVWVVIAFGLLGYLLRKIGWPPAPLILGLVLGTLFESSLRQSLAMSDGSLAIFVQRPLSAALLSIGAVAVATAAWLAHRRRTRRAADEAPDWA